MYPEVKFFEPKQFTFSCLLDKRNIKQLYQARTVSGHVYAEADLEGGVRGVRTP